MGNSAPSRPKRAGIATVILAVVSGVFWAGNLNGKVVAVAEECQQTVLFQAAVDHTQDQHWLLIRQSQLRLEDRLDAVLTVLRKQGERQAQQGAMLAALTEAWKRD